MKEPMQSGLGGPFSLGVGGSADAASMNAYHMFDKAHLVMLAEENLIPRQDAVAMLKALREMEQEGMAAIRGELEGGMHSGEKYLIRRLGYEVGGRIHLGRSSGDLGAVWRRVRERDRLVELMNGINRFREAILNMAEQNLDVVMPGYTGSQHAQPVTLGHQLMAWASVLERHFQRATDAYQRVNQSPAGAAIMTGSSFLLNRHRVGELLGFEGVLRNTFDAIIFEDDALETIMVAAIVHLSLSKWANDINFWFTSEAGYVDIPDRFCSTSSIMMQKKNPAVLSNVRASAEETIGGVVTTFGGQNYISGEFNTDGGASLHRAFDRVSQALGWFSEMIPELEVKKERMEEMAGSYWAQGTDVAAALVAEKGLPWRTAHQIVGVLVRFSYERGIHPKDVTPELLDEAAMVYYGEVVGLSRERLEEALDPSKFVGRRVLYGGPAPQESRRRLPEYRTQLEADGGWLRDADEQLQSAAQKLESAIDALTS
jgi:argininosuccinate lyase